MRSYFRMPLRRGEPKPRYKLYTDRAGSLYRRRQFDAAQKLLDEVPASPSDVSTEILRMHSAIMSNLYQSDGESIGTEANWAAVADGINRAEKSLHDRLGDTDTAAILLDRYVRLREAAGKVIDAISRRGARPSESLIYLRV